MDHPNQSSTYRAVFLSFEKLCDKCLKNSTERVNCLVVPNLSKPSTQTKVSITHQGTNSVRLKWLPLRSKSVSLNLASSPRTLRGRDSHRTSKKSKVMLYHKKEANKGARLLCRGANE